MIVLHFYISLAVFVMGERSQETTVQHFIRKSIAIGQRLNKCLPICCLSFRIH